MNRRQMLKRSGVAFGGVAAAGFAGRYFLLPPGRSAKLDTVQNLAVRFFDSLEGETRARTVVDYDHPLRQYHNRGVPGGGMRVFGSFNREQRGILTDLLHAGLSEQGRERVPNEFFTRWPGVQFMNVLMCGDPRTPLWQMILSGAHLNLRLGGKSRECVAFGGPMVYGDQRGDSQQGLPGNLYRYQFQTAHRLFRSLEPRQQQAAVLDRTPVQTQIELQGAKGSFPGIPVRTLSKESKAIAAELVDGILSTYHPEDVEYAGRCLAHNGGVDALSLAYYREGEVGGSGQFQIFRLEGPAAVFYFRGFPHVHAFVNVALDGDAPLSVGEVLGENPAVVAEDGVKRLFEDAMKHETRTDLGFYGRDSVVGRLRAGTIRTGDIYTLESWQDSITIVEIKGADMRGPLLDQVRRAGTSVVDGRTYSIAAGGYVDDKPAHEALGRTESRSNGPMVRDAVIGYLKARGFAQA
jgi:hypothetical protein